MRFITTATILAALAGALPTKADLNPRVANPEPVAVADANANAPSAAVLKRQDITYLMQIAANLQNQNGVLYNMAGEDQGYGVDVSGIYAQISANQAKIDQIKTQTANYAGNAEQPHNWW